jgi:hypothetical protein
MGDAIFEVVVAVSNESKLAVPLGQVRLGGEYSWPIAGQLDCPSQDQSADSGATSPDRSSDASNPDDPSALVQDSKGCHHRFTTLGPYQSRLGLEISTVKLAIGTGLLNDKDVDAKRE